MSESRNLPAGYASKFIARRKMLNMLGKAFLIEDPEGRLLFFVKQKAFKLKEDIRVFADEAQTDEQLIIKAATWADFSGQYVVTDATTEEVVGGARRKGLTSSFVRDHWLITDPEGEQIGEIIETGGIFATLRKLVGVLQIIPQKFEVRMGDDTVGLIAQSFGFFQYTYTCAFTPGSDLDPRLRVALVILLLAIEDKTD